MGKKKRIKNQQQLILKNQDEEIGKNNKNNNRTLFFFSDFFLEPFHRQILFLLMAVPWLLYWQTTGFELVWDDVAIHITDNPYLNPLNLNNLILLWKEPYTKLYIPLVYSIWGGIEMLNTWLFNEPHNSFIFHFVNILVHSLNGVLVFILLRQFIKGRWAALAGTLLFLTHPIQVESVAWISEFRGLGSTFFGFLVLYFYIKVCEIRYNKGNKTHLILYSIISFICFLCALLFKPSVVVIPAFAVLFEYYLFQGIKKESVIHMGVLMVPAAIIIWTTAAVQVTGQNYPFWVRPIIWMDTINFYLYKLCIPFSLAASYSRTPSLLMEQSWFYISWIIPVIIGGGIFYIRKKHPVLVLAALFFVIGILPVSGLMEFVFQQWSTTADRYLYLSMFGVALCFAYISVHMKQQWQKGLVLTIIFFWAGWSAIIQVPVWKNNFSLWSHCISTTPGEARAYNNRGILYFKQKEIDKALVDYTRAIAIKPEFAQAYNNRGNLYFKQKEIDKALVDYTRAIAIKPEYAQAYYNRGNLYFKQKEVDKALVDYTRAIAIKPEYAKAYNNRGSALLAKKKYKKALSDFTKAIKLDPGNDTVYFNRGIFYQQTMQLGKAIADYDQALEIDPHKALAYRNKGIVLMRQNKYERAISEFNHAIEVAPDSHAAYLLRGNAFQSIMEYSKAIADYNQSILLNPGNPELYNNRSTAFYYQKQYQKAVTDLMTVKKLGGTANPKLINALRSYMDN